MGAILPPPPPPVLDIWPVGKWRAAVHADAQVLSAPLNELRAYPLLLTRGRSFDRIGVDVTTLGTAGAVRRLGVFAHSPSTDGPGALVLDAGTVDATSVGNKEIVIALTLPAGIWWLADVPQVAVSTVRAFGTSAPAYAAGIGNDGQSAPTIFQSSFAVQAAVAGALPDPFVMSASSAGGTRVMLRRSA